jgi:hypothetical protein
MGIGKHLGLTPLKVVEKPLQAAAIKLLFCGWVSNCKIWSNIS